MIIKDPNQTSLMKGLLQSQENMGMFSPAMMPIEQEATERISISGSEKPSNTGYGFFPTGGQNMFGVDSWDLPDKWVTGLGLAAGLPGPGGKHKVAKLTAQGGKNVLGKFLKKIKKNPNADYDKWFKGLSKADKKIADYQTRIYKEFGPMNPTELVPYGAHKGNPIWQVMKKLDDSAAQNKVRADFKALADRAKQYSSNQGPFTHNIQRGPQMSASDLGLPNPMGQGIPKLNPTGSSVGGNKSLLDYLGANTPEGLDILRKAYTR